MMPRLITDDDYRRLQIARQQIKGIDPARAREAQEKLTCNADEATRRDLRIRYTEVYGFIPAWLARAL
jgi:hypothetical protein